MVFLYIYLALWAITFAYAVYDSHKKVTPTPFIKSYKFFGLKIADPVWFLLLFTTIIAPISIFVWLIDWIRSKVKNHKKSNSQTRPQEKQINIHVAGRLPEDIHTQVSIACANALKSGNWDEFAQYITEQTTFLYHGTEATTDCINELRKIGSHIQTMHKEGALNDISVETCKFYARACVVINPRKQPDKHYILFRIFDGKLTHIVHTPVTIKRGIRYNPFEDLPWTIEFLNMRSYDDAEPRKNHLPCFACGASSEQLRWRKLTLKNTQNVIDGVTSICPHCNRQVEYYIETQTEIPQPKPQDNEDLPF